MLRVNRTTAGKVVNSPVAVSKTYTVRMPDRNTTTSSVVTASCHCAVMVFGVRAERNDIQVTFSDRCYKCMRTIIGRGNMAMGLKVSPGFSARECHLGFRQPDSCINPNSKSARAQLCHGQHTSIVQAKQNIAHAMFQHGCADLHKPSCPTTHMFAA